MYRSLTLFRIALCFLVASLCTGLCAPYAMPAPPVQQGPDQSQRSMTDEEAAALRARLIREHADKANRVLDFYVKAQQALYHERFTEALAHVEQALALAGNADLLALKGAISFRAGNHADARKSFVKAFELDPAVPIPQVAGLTEWLRQEGW